MGRTENINVFQDTMNMCKDNDRIWESVHNSAEGQKLILEEDAIVNPSFYDFMNPFPEMLYCSAPIH